MNRDENNPRAKEAADWILAAQERALTKRERRQLAEWLRSSPANVREYLEAVAVWNDMARIDSDGQIDVDALSSTDGVVPFPAPSPFAASFTTRRSRLVRISAIAAAVVIALAAGVLTWQLDAPNPKTVSTELGEQRSVALDDGSIVYLNTQSRVRIHHGERRRFLELVAGEALFTVAEDPARPFVVRVGGAEVRVTGTQFNIRRRRDSAVVTVVAGTVRIGQVAAAPPPEGISDPAEENATVDVVEVVAGQQVDIDPAGRAGPPAEVSAERILIWTERRLVFDGDPLSVVAEEFNRYNATKLRIGDPEVGNLQLSGVFAANDPASLLEYLETVEALAVDVRHSGTTVTLHSTSD